MPSYSKKKKKKEFRSTVIRLLAGLEKRIEDTRETIAPEITDLKTSQTPPQKSFKMQTDWRLDIITMRIKGVEKRIGQKR